MSEACAVAPNDASEREASRDENARRLNLVEFWSKLATEQV